MADNAGGAARDGVVPPKLPARRNLGHLVANDLMERIRSGEYQPGDRLPTERGLMDMFGVGRNAAREAVQSLVAIGVLDVRPGRGAIVLGLGSDDVLDPSMVSALLEDDTIGDLYDFRELLEVEAAGRAAVRAGPAELARIDDALDRYRATIVHGTAHYLADLDFHRALAQASGNVIFPRILDAIADLLAVARQQTDRVRGAVETAMEEHAALRDAIAAGDPDLARQLMAQHIASARVAVAAARRSARLRSAERR